ncbi:phosphogluconate dehydratase [Yersinia pseudotuberculosis]|nr:phosphogluconate dehydratase [Yersinia pseudotuberculosis]SUP87214.1 phosphogluconate dehydratase [Yersinia pseudotuberculosis]
MNPIITRVTQRIIARSAATRTAYLQRISAAKEHTVHNWLAVTWRTALRLVSQRIKRP